MDQPAVLYALLVRVVPWPVQLPVCHVRQEHIRYKSTKYIFVILTLFCSRKPTARGASVVTSVDIRIKAVAHCVLIAPLAALTSLVDDRIVFFVIREVLGPQQHYRVALVCVTVSWRNFNVCLLSTLQDVIRVSSRLVKAKVSVRLVISESTLLASTTRFVLHATPVRHPFCIV